MDLDLRQSLLNTRRTIEGLITDIDDMITRSQNINNLQGNNISNNTNTNNNLNNNTNYSYYNPYYIPPPSYLSSNYYRYPYLNYLYRNNNYTDLGINNNNFYYNPGFNSYFRNLYNNPVNNANNYNPNTANISTNPNENQNINTEPLNINTEPLNINTDSLEINPLYDNSIDTNPEDTVGDNGNNVDNTDIDTTPREANLQNLNESLNETYREFQRIVDNQRRTRQNNSSLERRNAVRIPNVRNNQDIRRRIRRILPELVEITLVNGTSNIRTSLAETSNFQNINTNNQDIEPNMNDFQDVVVGSSIEQLRKGSSVHIYKNLYSDIPSCTICMENFNDEDIVRILGDCNHIFHITCCDIWMETNVRCPVCRKDIREINDEDEDNDDNDDNDNDDNEDNLNDDQDENENNYQDNNVNQNSRLGENYLGSNFREFTF